MFCEFCISIDFDRVQEGSADPESSQSFALYSSASKKRYPHHASYRDLIVSARNGCDLCAMIWMRDMQRRRQEPLNCSVRGWEKLRGLDALKGSDDGKSHVSVSLPEYSKPIIYDIDREDDPRIFCCTGFTTGWYDGWDTAVHQDVSPNSGSFRRLQATILAEPSYILD